MLLRDQLEIIIFDYAANKYSQDAILSMQG